MAGFLFPLEIEVRGELLVVGVTRRHYLWRAGMAAVVGPMALYLLYATVVAPLDEIPDAFDPIFLTAGFGFVLFGVGLAALSSILSQRTTVVFDRSAAMVRSVKGDIPFAQLMTVRLRPVGHLGTHLLEVACKDRTPLIIHGSLAKKQIDEASDIARTIGAFAGIPVEAPGEPITGPKDRTS